MLAKPSKLGHMLVGTTPTLLSVGDPEYILVFFNAAHLCVICFYFHYIFSESHWVSEKVSEKVYPFSSDIFSINFPLIHYSVTLGQ